MFDLAAQQRLRSYFDRIGELLGHPKRCESFAIYTHGLIGDGERRASTPWPPGGCADPAAMDAAHQRLLHFLNDSNWSNHEIRLFAARYAIDDDPAASDLVVDHRQKRLAAVGTRSSTSTKTSTHLVEVPAT